MNMKFCKHPGGCEDNPRRCMAEGCQHPDNQIQTLSPEEQAADKYLQERYNTKDVPSHWIKTVTEYAAERDKILKEAMSLLCELETEEPIGPLGGLETGYSVRLNEFLNKVKTTGEKAEPKATDDYKHCNHHHELTEDYQVVNFGDGEFVANKEAVPLLKSLNESGLKTRTHHMTGAGDAFMSILLDNVELEVKKVHEGHSTRTKYNGKSELLIRWVR